MHNYSSEKYKPLYHIIFWVIYFLFNTFRWGYFFDDYVYSLKSNLVEFPIHIIIVYFNLYVLIPKYIINKKIGQYLLFILLILFSSYLVRTGLNYLLVTHNIWPEAEKFSSFLDPNHIIAVTIGEIYVITFVTCIKLLIDWRMQFKRIAKLRELKNDTELDFLRTQMQPHFFFNTLNNLYSLSITQAKEVPKMIMRLSNFMEYLLYDTKMGKVYLTNELTQLQNLIEIYKVRHKDRFKVGFHVNSNIENIKVPPVLFINFLENCFKHGLKTNRLTFIDIRFEILNNNILEFFIVNNYDTDDTLPEFKKGGIGLKNTERRLKILYKNNYQLKTDVKGHKFSVHLKIPLK